MFYRKYRPQKFEEMSKPNEVADSLMVQLKNNKLGHAYLFVGSRGTGKTTTARIFTKSLNCLNRNITGDACDTCVNCLAIKSGNFPDLMELDAASNRGIDDMRSLRDRVSLVPNLGKYKVYILDEAHMLTSEAANALLKTLEEPPAHVIFILCTTEYSKIPETIRSRCQIFRFKRPSVSQIVQRLKEICIKEDVKITDEVLKKIALSSVGGFRDADTLLQQVVDGSLDLTNISHLSSYFGFSEFFTFIKNKNLEGALGFVNNVYSEGLDLALWSDEFMSFCREILLYKSSSADLLQSQDPEYVEMLKTTSDGVSYPFLVAILKSFVEAHNDLKSSFIAQLPLEIAVVSLIKDVPEVNLVGTAQKPQTPNPASPKPTSPVTNPVSNSVSKPTNSSDLESKTPSTLASEKEDTLLDMELHISSADFSPSLDIDESLDEVSDTNNSENLQDEPTLVDGQPDDTATTASSTNLSLIDVEDVKAKWNLILRDLKLINASVYSLIKSAKLLDAKDRSIILEVMYSFHSERLSTPKNRQIFEHVLVKNLGSSISFECVINKNPPKTKNFREVGDLTDKNLILPGAEIADEIVQEVEISDSLLDVFDGGLPAMS